MRKPRNAPDCRRCQFPMNHGEALVSTLVGGTPDFPSDTHGITLSPGGPGRMVPVWKCPKCGHSVRR